LFLSSTAQLEFGKLTKQSNPSLSKLLLQTANERLKTLVEVEKKKPEVIVKPEIRIVIPYWFSMLLKIHWIFPKTLTHWFSF